MKMYAVTEKRSAGGGHGTPSGKVSTLATDRHTVEAALNCAEKMSRPAFSPIYLVTGLEVAEPTT